MSKFMESFYNLIQTWQPFVWIIVVASIFFCGVGCIIPSDEVRKFCRRALPWIVIGTGLALFATTLGKEIAGAFSF